MGRDVFRSARQAVPDLSSELMTQTAAAVAETAPSHPLLKPGGNLREETVTHVHHWTDTLFTFKTTRDPSFRRSEEHTSELQSLMSISYAVFCLTKQNRTYRAHGR